MKNTVACVSDQRKIWYLNGQSLLNSFVCTQNEIGGLDVQKDSSYMIRHVWT